MTFDKKMTFVLKYISDTILYKVLMARTKIEWKVYQNGNNKSIK